jgi:sugar/nucleoside kinase (ribokinase family)
VIQRRMRYKSECIRRQLTGLPPPRTIKSMSAESRNAAVQALVFGSINVDLRAYIDGRLSEGSHAGETDELGAMPGGKGLNQAVALAQLNVTTHLVGSVGSDMLNGVVLDYLETVADGTALLIDGVSKQKNVSTGTGFILDT